MTEIPAPPAVVYAQPNAIRPVRPPLTSRARRGAAIAGSIGFVLLGLGYTMVALPVGLAILVGFFALIVRAASSSSSPLPTGMQQFFSSIDFQPWIAALVILALVGVVVMAVAIVLSGRILASYQVRRPWAVTWAGVGIAIVGSWVVSGVLGSFSSIALAGIRWDSPSLNSGTIVFLIVSAVVGIATNAAIGWLSWWWMAHAMRPAAVPAVPIGQRA